VRRDLTASKGRSLLVVAAIAIGVLAIGSVLAAYSILTREMDASYVATNPASAVLHLDAVPDKLVEAVAQRPEIAAAEARREISLRADNGDGALRDLRLIVVRDFETIRVARVTSEAGVWPPAPDEILIERSALSELAIGIGDNATLLTSEGGTAAFAVAGVVYDPGQTPAWIGGQGFGYVTPAALPRLGLEPTLDRLLIVAADESASIEQLRLIARDVAADLEAQGIAVRRIDVPTPGEHPNSEVMGTLLYLLAAFGVLALALSALLVATVIAALVGREVQQIAVMKAVGGRTRQIATMYLAGVAVLGGLALVIGLPLGVWAGRGYAAFIADRLNFDIASTRVDHWVYLLQAVAALLVPALAALIPVLRGSRITVRDGLDESPAEGASTSHLAVRLTSRLRGLPRPLLLGARNAARRQGRLLLTVLSLAFGGAVFMVALNVGAGWNRTIDTEFDSRGYDLELRLAPSEGAPAASVAGLPGVATAERWRGVEATLREQSGVDGDPLLLLAAPEGSSMARYPLVAGRRLQPGDRDAIVVSHGLAENRPELSLGGSIDLNVAGETARFEVVGIVRQIGDIGIGYLSVTRLEALTTSGGASEAGFDLVRIESTSDGGALDALARTAEAALTGAGFEVAATDSAAEQREVFDDHWILIVGMLGAMAMLVAAVGAIGMASTMSLNVIERRREIGVMRAVGAGTWTVLQVVLTEGLLIGALSWTVALALSLPLTLLVGNTVGGLLIQTPLELALSPLGVALWLAIVTLVAAVAIAIPALEASELPVHQVLAYE